MDLFFCIPIIMGCKTTVKPDGNQHPRICPRCHNGSVFSAKSRNWFEFCFVPLVPISSEHVWMCSICQWRAPLQQGWEPPVAGFNQQQQQYIHPGQDQGSQYQPTYLNHQK